MNKSSFVLEDIVMKNLFLTTGCFILVLCLSACNTPADQLTKDNKPYSEENYVIVTPGIRGETQRLQVGDTLEVQIPTIPTEGFAWVVTDLDQGILIQEGDAIYTPDSSPDSAGGIVTLHFKAVGTGETNLNLSYASESTDETPSFMTNTFEITVVVIDKDVATIVVTPAIRGNSENLQVGDILEIQIPTIPKEGYEWEVTDLDTTVLIQEGSAVYTADPSPDSAGGTVILRFRAVSAGTTDLSLAYGSGSIEESPSFTTNTFGMTVTVTD
jgi:predicted secreted protein